jgi:hypothetical protein
MSDRTDTSVTTPCASRCAAVQGAPATSHRRRSRLLRCRFPPDRPVPTAMTAGQTRRDQATPPVVRGTRHVLLHHNPTVAR